MLTSRAGRDRRGFSLLELLVVLLLLALSSALVLPAIDRGLKERELKQSALELAAVARDLRRRAVYENALQYLVLNPSENSYQTGIEGGEPAEEGLRRFLFFPNGSALGGEIGISSRQGSGYIIQLEPLTGRVVVVQRKAR
ncbi:MAG: hypothetical protein A3I10_02420 [Deltaproteobacteria bacterium RIFCSPLOWO2_02_FULL_57_26]|nr:MAG: hypothetical protein A3I10_02420 [Deltaproteobacteria bacterium RIFCSPLOWO2_02_FULL_57_26]